MKIIESVRIKYYRSILTTARGGVAHLGLNHLNIFVGENDAGKSNVLRALNMFFNHAELSNKFSFEEEFSIQRRGVKREETRFEIELVINPPRKQVLSNYGRIRWKKTWRPGSATPVEELQYTNGRSFQRDGRIGIYRWLKAIKYRYVPAIKSDEYFNELILQLYDVMQDEAKSLQESFTQIINEKSSVVSGELQRRLGIDSKLMYSGEIRDLFKALQFYSNEGDTPLRSRGDGIKVRHIPVLLQTMAQAEIEGKTRNNPISNTIWGFEEPENNLEFSSASKLAVHLMEYMSSVYQRDDDNKKYDEGVQILVTTHSPVFYSLANLDSDEISAFQVIKNEDQCSSIKPINSKNIRQLEDSMQLHMLVELSGHFKSVRDEANQLKEDLEKFQLEKTKLDTAKSLIVVTEDSDTSYIETILKSHGIIESEFHLLAVDGCTNLTAVDAILEYVKKTAVEPYPSILLHRDRDYISDTKHDEYRKQLKLKGVFLLLTPGTDIESMFLDVKHIESLELEVDAQEVIKEALSESKEESLKKFRNSNFGPNYKKNGPIMLDTLPEIYDRNVLRYVHGKTALKAVNHKIRKQTSISDAINRPSRFLQVEEWMDIIREARENHIK